MHIGETGLRNKVELEPCVMSAVHHTAERVQMYHVVWSKGRGGRTTRSPADVSVSQTAGFTESNERVSIKFGIGNRKHTFLANLILVRNITIKHDDKCHVMKA